MATPAMDERGDKLDRPTLEVFLLGLLDYEDALRLQRRLVYEASGSHGQFAALILCEHHPIITIGRRGSRAHIECDDDELAARGLAVRWVNRGGGCVLQTPGQLAAYSIWPFRPERSEIGDYVRRLERCLVDVLDEFDVRPTRSDESGIWTGAGQIASIGVAVSRWIGYHGMTLNVSGWKEPHRILHPEGNGALRVTTMEAERQRPAPMSKVRKCLVRKFVETLDVARFNLYTGHPMLRQPSRKDVYARIT